MIVDDLFEALKSGTEVRAPDDILEEDFGVTDPDEVIRILEELDNVGFRCEVCDWWCEISEMEGDNVCQSCTD